MFSPEFAVKLTIWLGLVAFVISMFGLLSPQRHATSLKFMRWTWAAGASMVTLHVLLAFAVHHDWSHQRAVQHTATETEAVLGIPFGGGVWFNYLFVLIWVADALWYGLRENSYQHRPGWITLAVNGYLAFIILNATVVFETGMLRLLAIVATIVIGSFWFQQRRFRTS